MTLLLGTICTLLILIVVLQLGRINDIAVQMRDKEIADEENNNMQGRLGMWFMVLFLVACAISAYKYKNYMLGYGPHESASLHGLELDHVFNLTLFFTGVVFILTHIALFWFAYKYRSRRGHVAEFVSHNDTLEIVWTIVPTIVLVILVSYGLKAWNDIMINVGPEEEMIQLEAVGQQFSWVIRYPGADGVLGQRYYKEISGVNPLGQLWELDKTNIDDFQPGEIVLPVNRKVKVNIGALDVLHSFFLPHFRVKMDAVPGMPTHFVFTPTKTTEEYRQELRKYPEYRVKADPSDPESPELWEAFEYELACAELCGNGHFSMRKLVKVVSEEQYEQWLSEQKSYFMSNIRGTEDDPFKGELLPTEIENRKQEFTDILKNAIASESTDDDVIVLKHLFYKTGSAQLDDRSRHELGNIYDGMQKYPNMHVELAGYTDNVGDEENNLKLSEARAKAARDYLVQRGVSPERLSIRGYGEQNPIGDNATAEGRQQNRRTEMHITKK